MPGLRWWRQESGLRCPAAVLDRSEQVAEWVLLAGEREVSRQVDEKIQRGRPEGGRALAAREIGVSEPQARRADKVASLAPEAKEAALMANWTAPAGLL